MTKREFFLDYDRNWNNETNQSMRCVAWEFYKLEISKKSYEIMIANDLISREFINSRDLKIGPEWLDEP